MGTEDTMEHTNDTLGKDVKDVNDDDDKLISNEELQNIERDVLEIEKNIEMEASNIVNMSSNSTTDQTMFLEPFNDLEKQNEVELLDEAAKVIELLTYDDCQELEQELEQSALCLEQMIPRTKTEVEFEDSEEESLSLNGEEESFVKTNIDINDCQEYLENSESEAPITVSELAGSDSELKDINSDFPAALEGSVSEVATDCKVTGSLNTEDLLETSQDYKTVDINILEYEDKSNDDLTESDVAADSAATLQQTGPDNLSSVTEATMPTMADMSGSARPHCSQPDSCIPGTSLGSAGACQPVQQEIDQKGSGFDSSDSLEQLEQLEYSEISPAGNSDNLQKHKKCPEIFTLNDDVEILRRCEENLGTLLQQDDAAVAVTELNSIANIEGSDKVEISGNLQSGKADDHCVLILESRELIGESTIVGDNSIMEQEADENYANSAMSKDIINGYLYPEIEASADEGWGDEILLDDLELNEDRTLGDVSDTRELDVLNGEEGIMSNEPGGELLEWLEKKEREFDMIMGSDQDPQDKDENVIEECDVKKPLDVDEPCHVEKVNLQAEILKQLTEKAIFVSSGDDKELESNDDDDAPLKPLEVIDESLVFTPTEEQLLDSNSVIITPMTVSTKVNRKKGSKTPKNPRKNKKSPLLRRKEIRTCISLHNACETSDVLEELMRPAISYGSNLNLVEAVENTSDKISIEGVKSVAIDVMEHDKVKRPVSSFVAQEKVVIKTYKAL